MPTLESYELSSLANFEQKEHTPTLPVENSPNVERDPISFGSYSAVFDLENGKVAKVSTFMKPASNEETNILWVPQDRTSEKYLAVKTGNPELDKQTVFQKTLELAKDKRTSYELLKEYLGDFVPHLDFVAIVDSPRQEIAKRKNTRLTNEQIAAIPNSEVAVMEIWDKVEARYSLQNLGPLELAKLYKDPIFMEQSKLFASNALRLLDEKGIGLDICDRGGIRSFKPDGTRHDTYSLDDLVQLKNDGILIYPRNLTFADDKLSYYDTYPLHEVAHSMSPEVINRIKHYLSKDDYYGLALMEKRSSDPQSMLQITRYLFLLREMGADISPQEDPELNKQESYPFSERAGVQLGNGYEVLVKELGTDWVIKEFNPLTSEGEAKSIRSYQRSQSKGEVMENRHSQNLLSKDEYYGDRLLPKYWIIGSDEFGTEKIFTVQKKFKGTELFEAIRKGGSEQVNEEAFNTYFVKYPEQREQLLDLIWTSKKIFVNLGVFDDFHLQNVAVTEQDNGTEKLMVFDTQNVLGTSELLYGDSKAPLKSKLAILNDTNKHVERYQKFEQLLGISQDEMAQLNLKHGFTTEDYEKGISALDKLKAQLEIQHT
jgi:hypothetical protein